MGFGLGDIVSTVSGGLLGPGFGGNSNAPTPNIYQPAGVGQADTNLQNILNYNSSLMGANSPYVQYAPQYAQLYNQGFNNPYAAGAQTAANTAGQSYGQVGAQGVQTGQALSGAAMGLLPQAQAVANMGLDPRQALYQQMAQQAADRANVTNAQYGLTGQQAAGAANQASTNFNIDWQNQQLQRALQGLGAYDKALGTAGSVGTAGQNLGVAGAGAQQMAGSTPYGTSLGVTGNQANALNQYMQSQLAPVDASASTIGALGNYMNTGINAQQTQYQDMMQSWQAQQEANAKQQAAAQQMWGTPGSLLSGLGDFSSGFQGGYSQAASQAPSPFAPVGTVLSSAQNGLPWLADAAVAA